MIYSSAVGFIHQTKFLTVLEQSWCRLHCLGSGKMDAAASMIEKAIVANPTYAEAFIAALLVVIGIIGVTCQGG
ncbi:hypothetical protein CsSME_00053608 [Camellia sinensis var. sinensis]